MEWRVLESVLKKHPEIVEGAKLSGNGARLASVLEDYFPTEQRNIRLLKQALDINILHELEAGSIDQPLIQRLSMRLVDEFCLQQEKAEWAVSMWCEAYGVGVLKKRVLHTEKKAVLPYVNRQTAEQSMPRPKSVQQSDRLITHVADMSYFQLENNGHALVKYIGPEFGNIIIPQGVTTIRKEAFKNCSGLQCITLPQGVTKIEENVFENCSGLQGISLPQSVTYIDRFAFSGCSSLKDITLPESIDQIKTGTFKGCSSLRYIKLPAGITEIGEEVFHGCTSLQNITLPEGIVQIKAGTFEGCSSLRYIELPVGITEIGEEAFRGCTSLQNIILPEHMNQIKAGTFKGCYSLQSITQQKHQWPWGAEDYVSASAIEAWVDRQPSITKIGAKAFSGCTSLQEVDLHGVTQIEAEAFSGCTNLQIINLYEVTQIETQAFSGCTSLQEIRLHRVTQIEAEAFSGCTSLQIIDLPKYVILGVDVFKGCISLRTRPGGQFKTGSMDISCFEFDATCHILIKYTGSGGDVVIPEGVWGIHKGAFQCPYEETDAEIRDWPIITSIKLPDSITEIGEEAFKGCFGLKDIILPNVVIKIGEAAFSGCSSLQSVKLPAGITEIREETFSGCSSLQSIIIPAHSRITQIKAGAFKGCSSLQDIGENLLHTTRGEHKIELPREITKIGEEAFCGCSNLQSIFLMRNNIAQIMAGTFKGCFSLQDVILSRSTTEIGEAAFRDCSSLQSITLFDGISSIADDAFECEKRNRIFAPLTIRARKGSYAQQYAKRMGLRFRSI